MSYFKIGVTQNLVPNGGFEYVTCTSSLTNWPVTYSDGWFNESFTLSTDIYHNCISDPHFQPPFLHSGEGYPFEGDGMAGFIPFMSNPASEGREIMSIALTDSLVKDSAYCVSFWVRNPSSFGHNYALDNVGVKFTEDHLLESDIHSDPDVRSIPNVLLEDSEWTIVEGYFIAKGGEKYFHLGTFGDRNSIDWYYDGPEFLVNSLPSYLYYFVDDVSVVQCDKDSILEIKFELPNVFTPNGDGINDEFVIKNQNLQSLTVIIVDRWGNIVLQYDGLSKSWDGSKSSAGVYFVRALAVDKFGDYIEKRQTVTLSK